MIRVALVDDQAIVRVALARILSPTDGFEVVAECVNGQEAVARLPALRPEVVVMDVRMPALDGIAATAQLSGSADVGLERRLFSGLREMRASPLGRRDCRQWSTREWQSSPDDSERRSSGRPPR